MAKKKRKTIKIEIPVPEPLQKVRKPRAEDLGKIKGSVPKADEIKRALPKKDEVLRFYRQNRNLVLAAAVVIAAIIAVSFFLISYQPATDSGQPYVPTKVNRTRTVTVTVPVNLSFDEYLKNYVVYEDLEISVTGFLKREIKWGLGGGSMGTYTYSVVDDFSKEINLTGLSSSQKALFPANGTSEGLFRVTGLVRLRYMGFDLEVTYMNAVERPETQVQKTIMVEETV